MATIAYTLCAITSLACAALLLRGYRRSRVRLLFWSAACFSLLAVNNVVLFIDLVVVTGVSLELVRALSAFAGLAVLAYGLIWETR